MKAIEKIDAVLEILVCSEELKPYADDMEIFTAYLKKWPSANTAHANTEFKAILKKLSKDGYVDVEEKPTSNNKFLAVFTTKSVYIITFEGDLFYRQGGYQGQISRRSTENIRLERVEKVSRRNQSVIVWLTILIAVGTLIAAWYYGIEIWRYYHPSSVLVQ